MSASNHFNDENSNTSNNPTFDAILQARLDRRGVLRTGIVSMVGSTTLGIAACGGGSSNAAAANVPLGFTAVSKSLADKVTVPAGYSAEVVIALGDPLTASTPDYKNDGTDTNFANRSGDHHDGMEWFGLDGNERGLLAINHEATTDSGTGNAPSYFLHANGGTTGMVRPASEVDKEIDIHGVSVVEVKKSGRKWSYVKDSPFNYRVTPVTEVTLSGPVAGNALVKTKYAVEGRKTRGTINNCGTGRTPWGSFLTGEENWVGYFARNSTDDAARADKSVTALKRYGSNQGAKSRHGWETAVTDAAVIAATATDKYARFNASKTGSSTDGSDDYRNELNGQGYIVEMDVYNKSVTPKKRTALGRFAHESAVFSIPQIGKPLAVYMGDDARGEYIYKFVSAANWTESDKNPVSRITTGDKFLDAGKLLVAKFDSTGAGTWVELSISNPLISGYSGYAFTDQADVLVNARLAADAVGATKMDRPEWCTVNPSNGEVYYTLTNNSKRKLEPASGEWAVDSGNPRTYSDTKGNTTSKGNVNGHILRLKEAANAADATRFTWDIYLFGAQSDAAAGSINLSNLTSDQDFSSPDGLAFSPATGILWIQTDDGAYTDVSNCMMLAALPGQVGDGSKKTLEYTKESDKTKVMVDTYVGKIPTSSTLKRFLVGAVDCEITGITETPDGKTLFVNIQHPGENTLTTDIANPSKYTSQWPSNAGYGAGKRPRSATIAITKNDDGKIGY
ncbi:MAG: hypothetical protein RIR79_635 [Pseudomonadota bacterium]|jgi:secreted PhoX family phosphatase